MSVYMTEDEQLEAIKKWWNRHGNKISICLTIVLLCVAGYRYMNWRQEKITQEASVVYEQMMVALANHDNKSVRSFATQLTKDYTNSVYADAAHMTLAKIYVTKNKLAEAKEELQKVDSKSKRTAIKQIAKIRLARILAAEHSYEAALQQLTVLEDKTYLPVINELKGDIYSVTGQYQQAINAYKQAMEETKTNGMANLFLEMKTNEVAMKNQSLLSDDKKIQTT